MHTINNRASRLGIWTTAVYPPSVSAVVAAAVTHLGEVGRDASPLNNFIFISCLVLNAPEAKAASHLAL